MAQTIGRNDPCPCGSGKKYKKCCLDKVRSVPSVISWDIDKVGSMSTDEIFAKLNDMGIRIDQDQFLQDVQRFYSASSLANHWLGSPEAHESGTEFTHYAVVILWERLAPDVINDETIDHLMQEGYLMLNKGTSKTACRLWLTVWGYLKPRVTGDMKSILDAECVFAGLQNLHNWSQDLEMELGNADLHEDRINYCHDFCELFPESPELIIQNMKMAEAEGYFNLGETDMAEALFSDLQSQYPDCVWVYCRWGDLFAFNRDSNISPDYEKAEKIYRMALDRNLNEDNAVTDRLEDLKTKR